MHSFSFGEIALVFGIVVILFGGSRLASIGKSLGEGISNFKKGLSGNEDNAKNPKQDVSQQSAFQVSSAYVPPQVGTQKEPSAQTQSQVIDVEQKEQG